MPFAKLLLFILVPAMLLSACEGFRSAHGIVMDKTTRRPLDSVLCNNTTGAIKAFTDSAGRFTVKNVMGGCIPDCKDIIVQFTKAGYKMLEVTNPSDTLFYLERQ